MADVAQTVSNAAPLLGLAGPEGMALAALLPALISLGKAGQQKHQQNQLAKSGSATRPTYQIPQAIQEATNNARYQANMTELPGANLMQQKINQQGAGALSNLKDVSTNGAQLGSNLAKIYRTNLDATNNLSILGAQNWSNNQAMLRGQLGLLGGAQKDQFDYNLNQPYRYNMAAQSALREGSFRNLSAAGQDIGAVAGGYGNYMNAKGDYAGGDSVESLKKSPLDMTGALSIPSPSTTSSKVNPDAVTSILKYNQPPPYKYTPPTSGAGAISSPIDGGTGSNVSQALLQFLMQNPGILGSNLNNSR